MNLDEEKYFVCDEMKRTGGGFVRRLGEALAHADLNNVARIKKAFPDYWYEYLMRSKERKNK